MKNKFQIKEALYEVCDADTEKRINTIEQSLKSIAEARNNETKSSAGDKYETGRAMLQIEEENSKTQLSQALRVKNQLSKINWSKESRIVELGSLVTTTNGDYYISIGIGKVTLNNQHYYCVSAVSPIGQKMMNKAVGDEIEFNGTKVIIKEIH